MTRRLLLLTALAVPLLWGGYRLTVSLTWEPGVTEANVGWIRPGMTQAEVKAIMGRDGYRYKRLTGGGFTAFYYCPPLRSSPAQVRFDDSGRVLWAEWRGPSSSFLERVRARLGW